MKNKNISAKKVENPYFKEIKEGFKKKDKLEPQEKMTAIDEAKKRWDMNDKIVDLFTTNIEKDQKLREKYAVILIIILSFELLALIVIFILKGCGILNYTDTTLNIFVSGGILEVIALVRLIVQYLFKDNLTEALKIILTGSNDKEK